MTQRPSLTEDKHTQTHTNTQTDRHTYLPLPLEPIGQEACRLLYGPELPQLWLGGSVLIAGVCLLTAAKRKNNTRHWKQCT